MKKIFITLFILLLAAQTAFCATARRESFNKMQKDNSEFYKQCSRLADSFKFDQKFNMYLKSSCMDFEFDRRRLLDSIYPTKLNYPNYIDNYQNYRTDLSIRLNKEKLNSYKPIIEEYCGFRAEHSVNAKSACKKVKEMF